PPPIWDELAGIYPCADGFVRLHTNFPQHRDGVLRLLSCEPKREAIASALLSWESIAFEEACAEAGIVGSAYRQLNDWLAHRKRMANTP
ncbi:MAG: CoA transferase, partial [Burkholderiales bacterium]